MKEIYYDVSTVQAGASHTCAIRTHDSTVDCWGSDWHGQATPPDDAFESIAAGETHNCGIQNRNGIVQCWGSDATGESTPPANVPFIALALGRDHSCGIRADGEIQCWGNNGFNKSFGGPKGTRYKALSAGVDFTCGIREKDSKVECWGHNEHGKLNPPNTEFRSLSSYGSRTCGITFNSRIACWGEDADFDDSTPTEGMYVAVTVGGKHACAVRINNVGETDVVCWGDALQSTLDVPEELSSPDY